MYIFLKKLYKNSKTCIMDLNTKNTIVVVLLKNIESILLCYYCYQL